MNKKTLMVMIISAFMLTSFVGCGNSNTDNAVKNQMNNAANDVKDSAENIGNDVKNGAENLTEDLTGNNSSESVKNNNGINPYRFDYNGSVAYVSNKYVGANRVGVQATATSGHWYDGYQYYTWYDMGSYFFYLTPTQEEANQAACDCSQGRFVGEFLWQPELWSRYPGRAVSYFSTSSDGFGIAMACSNYEDENWFYRPKYLWETVPSSPRVRFVD